MTPAPDSSVRRVLVVRTGRGGDLIMITPALNALLAAFPAADFHLLTTGEGRRILAGYDPRLSWVHLYSRRFPQRLLRERELRGRLASEGYDRIYVFETKPHYRRWLAGVAPRLHALDDAVDGRHWCDRCLDLVAATVDGPIARTWVTLPLAGDDRRKARSLLADHGVGDEVRLVGLHPTFSGARLPLFRDRRGNRHRLWPPASFAALARRLADRARADGLPLAIVIDSLPDDATHARRIAERSGGAVTVLAAPPDFGRYKGLLSLLDVLVTPNTGPMHMAAALNTPLVALFSHWSPADCGPYMDPSRRIVLRAEDTDRPRAGLAAIAPATVAEAAWSLLTRPRES